MKPMLLSLLSLVLFSCGKQRPPLKTKEIHTTIQQNIGLTTLQIANEQGYEKDTLNIAFAHTDEAFINETERQHAETFFKQAIAKDEGLLSLFSNFSIKQRTTVIKNDHGILGFLIEQSHNGQKTYATRYYQVEQKQQVLASQIFYPQENLQKLSDYLHNKYPELHLEATDAQYKAFQFDKDGSLTLYFPEVPTPITLSRDEVGKFGSKPYREVFNYPPPVDCGKYPCVALTFDDGPSEHTPRLLDILKENDAKATFFVLGTMATHYPEILKRAYAEGHQIGNHSWNHKNLKKLTQKGIADQVLKTNERVKDLLGEAPQLMRPPYGAFNPLVTHTAKMPIVLWALDPLDWRDRNPHKIAERMANAQPGSIILAHDIHKTTVEAIPEAIKALKAKGYHLVTVEDLFYPNELQAGKVYSKRH